MNYKIVIITIDRNEKRYKTILDNLIKEGFDKEDIKIIKGIDYKLIPKKKLISASSFIGKLITPYSVLACASSHILTWYYISTLNDDTDYYIILEDDSYILKDQFNYYRNKIEERINDKTLINLSKGFRIKEYNQSDNNLFIKSHMILSLDTYILTPNLAKILYSYYKENGIYYHIDFHLSFVKDTLKMNLLHFNRNIKKDILRTESSMVENHNKKFFLNMIKGTEVYKDLNTPIMEINNNVFSTYSLLVCFFIFIFILLIIIFVEKEGGNIFEFLFILFFLIFLVLLVSDLF